MIKAPFDTASATLTACLSLALVSCGGSTPAPADATSTDTAAAAVGEGDSESPAPVAWKDMDREQRLEFMGLTVMPAMEKLFKEYDAEAYAEFKCQTCHGEDMEAVDYKLPNGLYSLPEANPVESAKEYDAEVTAFMVDKITPKMAELLQEGPNEFGCLSCHEKE